MGRKPEKAVRTIRPRSDSNSRREGRKQGRKEEKGRKVKATGVGGGADRRGGRGRGEPLTC